MLKWQKEASFDTGFGLLIHRSVMAPNHHRVCSLKSAVVFTMYQLCSYSTCPASYCVGQDLVRGIACFAWTLAARRTVNGNLRMDEEVTRP